MNIVAGTILICMMEIGSPRGFIKDVETKVHHIFKAKEDTRAFIEFNLTNNVHFKFLDNGEPLYRILNIKDIQRKGYMKCRPKRIEEGYGE